MKRITLWFYDASEIPMASELSIDALRNEPCLPSCLWDHYLYLSNRADEALRSSGCPWTEQCSRAFIRTLPPGIRLVVRFVRFDSDVLNGGLQQFVYNNTPLEVCETLDVLETVQATESARLLRETITIYETKYDWPRTSDDRWLDGPPDDYDDPDLERLTNERCDEESSRRDYAIVHTYLSGRLETCLPDDE